MKYTKSDLNDLTYEIIGAAIEVHRHLGPGLLESVYHSCLKEELKQKRIGFESEFFVPLTYKNKNLSTELRCDLLIENCIAIELKAVDKLHPVHDAQLMTYMRLLKVPKGILINFNSVNIFKEGQRTFVNDLFRQLPE